MNSKSTRQLRKRNAANKEASELNSAKKKCKTVATVGEEESDEEEIVYSSESPESSEKEDDDITIQSQHPRLATRIGFN